ncbi:hypothetical protein RQP46_002558 [Phenoliferia psychrophenolica]
MAIPMISLSKLASEAISFDVNTTLGPLVGGTWLNSGLYAAVIIYSSQYFATYIKDPTWIKALVAFVVTIDFVCTLSGYALAYQLSVLAWGNEAGLSCYYWDLLNRTTFGGCCACAGMIVQFPSALQRDKLRTPAIIWLSASAGSDLIIAAILASLLAQARRAVTNPNSRVYHPLIVCEGRIATLSLLYNLNLRKATAKRMFGSDGLVDSTTESNGDKGSFPSRGRSFKSTVFGGSRVVRASNAMELQGVSMHVEEHTVVEDDRVQVVSFNVPTQFEDASIRKEEPFC